MPGSTPLNLHALGLPVRLTLAASVILLSGCSRDDAVSVSPPVGLDSTTTHTCEALVGHLPAAVFDAPARSTDPVSPLVRAWGDPAIVFTCGVGSPGALTATSQIYSINDVTWLPEDLGDATRFTTVGRNVNVQVVVPNHYSPAGSALIDVADAITRATSATTTPSAQSSPAA